MGKRSNHKNRETREHVLAGAETAQCLNHLRQQRSKAREADEIQPLFQYCVKMRTASMLARSVAIPPLGWFSSGAVSEALGLFEAESPEYFN